MKIPFENYPITSTTLQKLLSHGQVIFLIEPLQKVWKDGIIDEAELDSLTKLLACIVQPKTPKQKTPQAQSLKDSSVKTNKRRRREVGNLRKRQWGLGLVAIVAVLIMRAAGCDTSRRSRRRRR